MTAQQSKWVESAKKHVVTLRQSDDPLRRQMADMFEAKIAEISK